MSPAIPAPIIAIFFNNNAPATIKKAHNELLNDYEAPISMVSRYEANVESFPMFAATKALTDRVVRCCGGLNRSFEPRLYTVPDWLCHELQACVLGDGTCEHLRGLSHLYWHRAPRIFRDRPFGIRTNE